MPFEYEETFGARIRQFIKELFGSRLTAHLEEEILRLRNDYEARLHDKDLVLASLREDKQLLMSKNTAYELTIMPHSSRMGAEVVAYQKPKKPNFSFVDMPPTKSRWEEFQDNYYKEEAKIEEEAAKAAKV